ncbi:DUF2946 family protein [Sphingopyxis sp. 550A]
MTLFRTFVARHRWLAFWLVVTALVVKLVVPAGFMPAFANGTMTIQLCTGQGVQTIQMEIPGTAGDSDNHDHHKKADMPCAFAGLSTPTLAAADPLLLVVAIAFIIATVFLFVSRPVLARRAYLRPPLRGPPATA